MSLPLTTSDMRSDSSLFSELQSIAWFFDIDKNMGMYDDIYINNSYDEENSDRKAR